MTTRTYANEGDVRGRCEHKHRTITAVRECLEADYDDCNQAGGYSDRRRLVVYESGEVVDAADDETEEWYTGHC